MRYPIEHIIAVDPGDKHVGVAEWRLDRGRYAMESRELDAPQAPEWVDERISSGVQALIIEEFRLYKGKALAQSGSAMLTAEMIGALKWIAGVYKVPVVLQPAAIKIPTRAQCKARNFDWQDRKSGHASDARLHAWYYLLRNRKVVRCPT
jgi:hypothetical protein